MNALTARPHSFRHGIHLQEHKQQTVHLPTQRMPFVSQYILPLSQHAGKAARSLVKSGERVQRGQLLAKPDGFISTALHSPVTGRVTAIAPRRHPDGRLTTAIEIEADPYATQRYAAQSMIDWRTLSRQEFVEHVQQAGLVGMGGAAFPSHVKYAFPDGRCVKHLVINGAECEPYLTCDHRLMLERPAAVLQGIEILRQQLGAERASIGVEMNKPDAIRALRDLIRPDQPIAVVPLQVKYPQGAEKILIQAMFGVEVPAGKLPIDLGMVVNNVATVAALADYFGTGMPLIERTVTVAGPGVVRPANLQVPIGTPVRDVLAWCGGLTADTKAVIMGGPMMGTPLVSLDVPILKGSTGILAFSEAEMELPTEYTCIHCGRCIEACPMSLNPSRLGRLAKVRRHQDMEKYHVMDCMECGSCTFACPSGIPIVQLVRMAKAAMRKERST